MTAKEIIAEIEEERSRGLQPEPHVIDPNAVYDEVTLAWKLRLWRDESTLEAFLEACPCIMGFTPSGRRLYLGERILKWMRGEFKKL